VVEDPEHHIRAVHAAQQKLGFAHEAVHVPDGVLDEEAARQLGDGGMDLARLAQVRERDVVGRRGRRNDSLPWASESHYSARP
jgi:hypothetical protein